MINSNLDILPVVRKRHALDLLHRVQRLPKGEAGVVRSTAPAWAQQAIADLLAAGLVFVITAHHADWHLLFLPENVPDLTPIKDMVCCKTNVATGETVLNPGGN